MQNKNPTRFYYKKGIEQGYDKEMYRTLVLNRQKVTRNVPLFIRFGHLAQGNFSKSFESTCDPSSPMCTNVHSCVNYEWNKIQLIVN